MSAQREASAGAGIDGSPTPGGSGLVSAPNQSSVNPGASLSGISESAALSEFSISLEKMGSALRGVLGGLASASSGPSLRGRGFVFRRVLLSVAPPTDAFKVLWAVVEVVTVLVVNLAHASFGATNARPLGTVSPGVPARPGARACLSVGIARLGDALAARAAIGQGSESVPFAGPSAGVM